jgi:2-polyprenyl-3-methyl-5-hydroxy-6-metoxy-1,4-benzoquinol methylase
MDREHSDPGGGGEATAGPDYADRLVRLRSAWWKHVIDVQAPYRWNIRRLRLGRTLDVGCGIGRNLHHLGPDSVGVDHNAGSVAVARSLGLTGYTVEEFRDSPDAVPASFDTLLLAHVAEHMNRDSVVGILTDYLMFLKPEGRVILITPQEAGYRTDQTHVRFVDFAGSADLASAIGFEVVRKYSFPFPRIVGKVFPYNEFVTVTRPAPEEVARL